MSPSRRTSVVFPTNLPTEISGAHLGLRSVVDAIEAHDPNVRVEILHLGRTAAPRPDSVDVAAFSISNPLEFGLVFDFCRATSIPRRSDRRNSEMPLFVGGGIGFANPEPLGAFLDVIVCGLDPLPLLLILDIIADNRDVPRRKLLDEISRVPNVYIPERVHLEYASTGEVTSVAADYELRIKPSEAGLKLSGTVSDDEAVLMPDIGCRSRCSFCALTFQYDYRAAAIDDLVAEVDRLAERGIRRIKINSATAFQHPEIDALLEHIRVRQLEVALGSVRLDQVRPRHVATLNGMHRISPTQHLYRDGLANGAAALTFGLEAASSRLLGLLNKGLDADQIRTQLAELVEHGLRNIGFYFMCGIPTETIEDRREVGALIADATDLVADFDGQVVVNVNPLIPTPLTGMQRAPMASASHVMEWMSDVRSEVARRLGPSRAHGRVRIDRMPVGDHVLETLTIRSDRRIGAVLEAIYDGCRKSVRLDEDRAARLLTDAGLPPLHFFRRRIGDAEILPWTLVEPARIRSAEQAYLRRERLAMASV